MRFQFITLLPLLTLIWQSGKCQPAVSDGALKNKSAENSPGKSWIVSDDPAIYGWSVEKLDRAKQFADSIGTSAVMILQGSIVVRQWGDVSYKYNSYSIRKSLISSLYGIYVGNGTIDINQTIGEIGIDDHDPVLTKQERSARVVDLLRARSGVYHAVDFETQAMKNNRPAVDSHLPGTFWFYNNWDFNVLGTIFEKKAKMSIGAAFHKHIAVPIGMEDFKPTDVFYIGGPISDHRAFHFLISTRDLARFGLLYLNKGRWRDDQILPSHWVDKSSKASEVVTSASVKLGYEYLWWIDNTGELYNTGDPGLGLYAARGHGEHAIIIIPSLNLVIVHRVANEDIPPKDTSRLKVTVNAKQLGSLLKLILDAYPK